MKRLSKEMIQLVDTKLLLTSTTNFKDATLEIDNTNKIK